MTGTIFGLKKEDVEYMSDPENRFIFEFNLLWTSGDYWDRTPENVKRREDKLRKLYRRTIKENSLQKIIKDIEEWVDVEPKDWYTLYDILKKAKVKK